MTYQFIFVNCIIDDNIEYFISYNIVALGQQLFKQNKIKKNIFIYTQCI